MSVTVTVSARACVAACVCVRQAWAWEYSNNIIAPVDNLISRGTERFLSRDGYYVQLARFGLWPTSSSLEPTLSDYGLYLKLL
eukprot:1648687-Pleurochrysis_carterae.AAC.1